MPKEYTKEEYWKIFNNLSETLQETILSPRTAEEIEKVAKRNEVDVSNLANIVSDILLGTLTPSESVKVLEKELKIKNKKAKQIKKEIIMFILHPVKEEIENLYEIKIETPSQKEIEKGKEKEKERKKDRYREPIN